VAVGTALTFQHDAATEMVKPVRLNASVGAMNQPLQHSAAAGDRVSKYSTAVSGDQIGTQGVATGVEPLETYNFVVDNAEMPFSMGKKNGNAIGPGPAMHVVGMGEDPMSEVGIGSPEGYKTEIEPMAKQTNDTQFYSQATGKTYRDRLNCL